MGEQYALANAVAEAAEQPGRLPARVVPPRRPTLAAITPGSRESVGVAIAAALEDANNNSSASVQHAAGIASLMTGRADDAARYFGKAVREDDAAYWANYGAALYALALQKKDNEHVLASLGASNRALTADPERAEAAYNFALAVEHLGVLPAAAELWNKYLQLQDGDTWRGAARAHVTSIGRSKTSIGAWGDAVTRGDVTALAQLAAVHPQEARMWTERYCLASWAADAAAGDQAPTNRWLTLARAIGATLRKTSGESMVSDAVTIIDRALASRDAVSIHALIDGHARYAKGRALYRDDQLNAARAELETAEKQLSAAHSPMRAIAAAYVASIEHDAAELQPARDSLDALMDAGEAVHPTHYALRAQLEYQSARLDAVRGFWSDSLAESTRARALYHRIGETGNEGMSALVTAEAYDFIGQPAVAARHSVEAIRLLSDAGDVYRLRVAVGYLCRTATRRGMWDTGRALIRVERALEPLSADPILTSDTSIRHAIIEENTGHSSLAAKLLERAEREASELTDESYRALTFADIHGASGALVRRRDPAMAVSLLSKAIAYQEKNERNILLPQLYLERGRAHRDLLATKEAAADFEQGIRLLEKQREHLYDAGMRYGIFDDSHELFTEAMSLRLASGDERSAFAILERGRARALLEQIAGAPSERTQAIDLATAQRAIPERTLVVEYAVFPDRLLLFLVARDFAAVRQVRIEPAALTNKTSALVAAMAERRPRSEVEALASDLYSILIAPVRERNRYPQLVLVPDGTMQQVPFAALYDERARTYLAEQHVLASAPSTAVYLESRARWSELTKTPSMQAAVFAAAAGDPALELRALPDVPREAQEIATIYGKREPEKTASAHSFIEQTANADIAHFAGHALIDPADPAQSALVFTSASEDRLLSCRQIGKTGFHRPRVVVLAACSTMVGRMGRTEGTPSIARSFLAAGAPNVIGTLWDVEDADSSALIADVHRKLAAGATPAAALHDAQVTAIHSRYPASRHPGSWAAFALLGAGGL